MKAVCIALALGLPVTTNAFPEGAPWGAANPDTQQNCASCHFDYEAARNSQAAGIEGLPAKPVGGETYLLTVRFEDGDAVVAGFQMLADAGGRPAGAFASDADDIEFDGARIRSTRPSKNTGVVTWTIEWTAPDEPGQQILFYLAITGANDDGSPFGDQIHFRSFSVTL